MSASLQQVARIGRPMSGGGGAEEVSVRVAGLLKLVAAGQANGSYTPSIPGKWASPAPTTVQQALDRIATALEALIGSPIP